MLYSSHYFRFIDHVNLPFTPRFQNFNKLVASKPSTCTEQTMRQNQISQLLSSCFKHPPSMQMYTKNCRSTFHIDTFLFWRWNLAVIALGFFTHSSYSPHRVVNALLQCFLFHRLSGSPVFLQTAYWNLASRADVYSITFLVCYLVDGRWLKAKLLCMTWYNINHDIL